LGVCAHCNEEFDNKSKLTSHIVACISQDVVVQNFSTKKELENWIENMQQESNTYYSAQTGAKVHKDIEYSYLYCQHLARLQSAKAQKPRKTCRRRRSGLVPNYSCTSKIVIHREREGGLYKMKFLALHNHFCSPEYLKFHQFPKSLRRILIAKLEMGITSRRILCDARHAKWSGLHRNSLTLTKIDLMTQRYYKILSQICI
jgi:hypothetical protein